MLKSEIDTQLLSPLFQYSSFALAGVFLGMGWAPTYGSALLARSLNALINLPLRAALLYALGRFGKRFFDRFERMLR